MQIKIYDADHRTRQPAHKYTAAAAARPLSKRKWSVVIAAFVHKFLITQQISTSIKFNPLKKRAVGKCERAGKLLNWCTEALAKRIAAVWESNYLHLAKIGGML
jgi:hypothetical protein